MGAGRLFSADKVIYGSGYEGHTQSPWAGSGTLVRGSTPALPLSSFSFQPTDAT